MIQFVKQCYYILTCLLLLPVISEGNAPKELSNGMISQPVNLLLSMYFPEEQNGDGRSVNQGKTLLVMAEGTTNGTLAQQQDLLAEPAIRKVEFANREVFQRRFRNIKWTGAGFQGSTVIDQIPTTEIRARLQKQYGDPTQKLKHLMYEDNFRPGHYIQFEYWFVINDEIPMMVLDIDGPFGNGLVFAGASRYVDLMPEIKRTLTRKLMEAGELGEYEDHYFEMNGRQWYLVQYRDGSFENIKIGKPGTLK